MYIRQAVKITSLHCFKKYKMDTTFKMQKISIFKVTKKWKKPKYYKKYKNLILEFKQLLVT